MLRWDNFIELYNAFNLLNFNAYSFVMPDSPPVKYAHHGYQPLEKWIEEPISGAEIHQFSLDQDRTSVLNLDIDVLFGDDKNHSLILGPEQMKAFADKVGQLMEMSSVTTIALSPEFCGGCDQSLEQFKQLNDLLQLGFDMKVL